MNRQVEVIRVQPEKRVVPRKHINKITLQGVVMSDVRFDKLKSNTPSCVFEIVSRETFKSRGNVNWHDNKIVIEALGSQANKAKDLIKRGGEYIFDGYLRVDTVKRKSGTFRRMRVRVYHIESL